MEIDASQAISYKPHVVIDVTLACVQFLKKTTLVITEYNIGFSLCLASIIYLQIIKDLSVVLNKTFSGMLFGKLHKISVFGKFIFTTSTMEIDASQTSHQNVFTNRMSVIRCNPCLRAIFYNKTTLRNRVTEYNRDWL